MTDREKIEFQCWMLDVAVRRVGKSSIIASRRYYFNDEDEVVKIIDLRTGEAYEDN